jgi:hypothetical protein
MILHIIYLRALSESSRRRLSLEPVRPRVREAGLTEGVLATAFCCLALSWPP